MPYHHVIAKLAGAEKGLCLFSDLSTSELKRRFIVCYEKGESFFSGNDLISPADLRSVQIVRTAHPEAEEREAINRQSLAQIDEMNRSGSDLFFLSLGSGYEPADIALAGEDVTRSFISGPPGTRAYRSANMRRIVGWVGTIVATVLAAGVVKWLGWL